MSLPEISRRCLGCGASVRASARFCPQCGSRMDAGESPGETAARGARASAPDLLDDVVLKETFSLWESASQPSEPAPPAPETTQPRETTPPGETTPAPDGPKPPAAPPAEHSRPSVGQAAPAGGRAAAPVEKSSAESGAGRSPDDNAPANVNASTNVNSPASTRAADGVKTPAAPSVAAPTPSVALEAGPSPAGSPPARRRTVVAAAGERTGRRVEKLREASMGVLEEASEDTGLRFVLVAIALFVLALVVLVVHSALK